MAFTDAPRGYAHRVLSRDNFTCTYCGLDGRIWPNWLYLSWDHLLPKGHPMRDDEAFIVVACRFCNEACNRTTFWIEGITIEQIVAAKRLAISVVRGAYREFWEANVASPASMESVR